MISIDDFQKIDIRIGTIVSAGRVEGTDKLLRLEVDIGEEAPRQVVSGIAEFTAPEDLIGKQCPFLVNLEPRVIHGLESQGMILAVGDEEGFALLHPARSVALGSRVK